MNVRALPTAIPTHNQAGVHGSSAYKFRLSSECSRLPEYTACLMRRQDNSTKLPNYSVYARSRHRVAHVLVHRISCIVGYFARPIGVTTQAVLFAVVALQS
eukprot:21521-Heterococcus_DN1.PRE.1